LATLGGSKTPHCRHSRSHLDRPFGESRGHRQPDRQHDDTGGLEDPGRTRRAKYPTGIKITDAELASLNLKQDNFHGDWNYTVLPERKKT